LVGNKKLKRQQAIKALIWADECPSSSNFKILRACNWVNAYQRLSFHRVAGFVAFGHKSCGNLYPAGSKDLSIQQSAKTLSGAARIRLRRVVAAASTMSCPIARQPVRLTLR
jgi:hypothetical protein